jgi:putative transposase
LVSRTLGVSRNRLYERQTAAESYKQESADNQDLLRIIRNLCKMYPTYGYRRIWALLKHRYQISFNVKRVHRLMQEYRLQVKQKWHWPYRRQAIGKVQVTESNRRWAIDLTKIYCGKDGWGSLIAIIDCCDREIVGYRFGLHGRAREAVEALGMAMSQRFPENPTNSGKLELIHDNGSIFLAKKFMAESRFFRIEQRFIPPREPENNGMIERFFRTLKEECVWQTNFESFAEAEKAIVPWLKFYNEERIHSSLGYQSPKEFRQSLRKFAA